MRRLCVCVVLAACGGSTVHPDAAPPDAIAFTTDWTRDVTDTDLHFDLAAKTATATITIAGSTTSDFASFEIGDLAIASVTDGAGHALPYRAAAGELDVAVPRGADPATFTVAYAWTYHTGFMGADQQFTLTWPYYCGNLFPCKDHATPADGTRFTLALDGVPAAMTAVYPTSIPSPAPDYQLAWAIGDYHETDLGTTTAGTLISTWAPSSEQASIAIGAAHLVAAFDWMEQHLGAYSFGDHFGAVDVHWPPGAYGGMEHHPYVHIANTALADESVLVHEAAHGWFGDGIRLRCWEDFVLSEGTVSYLAAHVLGAVESADTEAGIWRSYASRLARVAPGAPWPASCGQVDVLTIFNEGPYMRGAYFYKSVADHVGAGTLDTILAAFYAQHHGDVAGMQDMIDLIHTMSGWDPTACAQIWLRDAAVPTYPACT